MSDHDKTHDTHDGHDGHEAGGHEVDKMPSGRLFNLLFGLSALTLVACIGVVQLFYRQVDTIRDARDTKVSFQLAEYRQEMDELKGGRVVEMTDDDGVPATEGGRGVYETRHYQMPLAEARKRVLEQPQLLKSSGPYRGWRNPDANAPKPVAPVPRPRNPMRPGPGVDGKGPVPLPGGPGGVLQPTPGGMGPAGVQPAQPAEAPAEGKAPAKGEGKAEGKAPEGKAPEGKAPARGEGKAEGKAPEGKANE
jgi:hypothetical protein